MRISSPNPEDPLDSAIADMWLRNPVEARNRARQWTESYGEREILQVPNQETFKPGNYAFRIPRSIKLLMEYEVSLKGM